MSIFAIFLIHLGATASPEVEKMSDNSSSHITRVLFCGAHFPASHNYTREYLQGYPFVQVFLSCIYLFLLHETYCWLYFKVVQSYTFIRHPSGNK